MPTYRNDTDKRITFAHKATLEWMPGQVRKLEYFVPHFLLGLTIASPEPWVTRGKNRNFGYHEMIIFPDTPVSERTYWMPYWETVQISIFILESDLNIKPTDQQQIIYGHDTLKLYIGDSDVPQIIDTRNNHLGHFAWDISAYLVFEAEQPTSVAIKVEPYVFRGTDKISGR